MQTKNHYHRILLKLSGEALMGQSPYGIQADACSTIAHGIKDLVDNNIQVGVVVGGGNIFRGIEGGKLGIERTPSDHMGMLATIMNAIAMQQALKKCGVDALVMSAINCQPIVDSYNYKEAIFHLEKNRVVLFAGGTGSPYFTTDTAAALRASEIQAQILLKATKVNGVYSKDPMKHKDAVRYDTLSYADVLAQKLDVMDATAVALCMSNHIPILVFNMWATSKLSEVLVNPELGTHIH
ncbi:MAG: UMP kinase [Chlamydiales bacterium]|nr:UMP kinase [Chlamydiales bacterium]